MPLRGVLHTTLFSFNREVVSLLASIQCIWAYVTSIKGLVIVPQAQSMEKV